MTRIFSIADIHGRFDLLEKLMWLLNTKHQLDLNKDKIVFTGDYVDRGPKSFEVLNYIYKLQKEHPDNIVVLAGNHEHMMIDYYKGWDHHKIWLYNGGMQTMESFWANNYDHYPAYLLDWVEKLPVYHKEPGFFFSHAPIPKAKYRAPRNFGKRFTVEEMTWSCPHSVTEKEYSRVHKNAVGVCGHIHALKQGVFHPRFYKHYIFGDSGCGCHKDAPLCAINVKTREVIYSIP